MRKLFFTLFSAIALLVVSCTFDDSSLSGRIDNLESRVAALEQLCNQMNTNITSLQTIVGALQNNDYVTNIAPITEGNKTIGYTISFSKSNSITIYLGGDASALQIGVKQHSDGLYYWTLGGEWLIDDSGNKVKAQGNMPMLKIENDYWYVSYDNGTTWSEMSKVTSGNADLMFNEVTYDDDYVYLTLSDGTILILPRRADFTDIPANEIWYTTNNGSAITLSYPDGFDVKIISNLYEKSGRGIITFDGDVTSIGEYAFSECESLVSITLPKGITEIGEGAFNECESLVRITLPKGVQSIGRDAFKQCYALTSITIPEGVLSIGDYAFNGCNALTSITLPESITEIGYDAFMYCSSLTAFYGKYASEDNRCLIVDGELLVFARAGLTSYTIPNGVTSIGGYAFYECSSLVSITLPNSVQSIGDSAFSDCESLKSIAIPNSVTSIGRSAFYNCSSLNSITLPEGITSIGGYAFFGGSSLTTLYCKPETPPMLGDISSVFYNTSLSKIYVPASSVNAYKNASGWKNHADIIEGYDFSN